MKQKVIIFILMMFACSSVLMAQVDRKNNRHALRALKEKDYNEAIIGFSKAVEENAEEAGYVNNLGHAYYSNEDFEEAAKNYALYADKAGLTKADQFYNLGNSFLQAGDYDKGIQSYIQSLKLDPSDKETKYNLSMAHAMKRQQQQRQQQQDQNKDDQNKDKQDQNKEKNKNQDQQDKKDQDQKDQQQEKQQQQNQQEMSREDAERMLQALQKREEDLQDEQKKKAKANIRQPEKDW